jgi:predicted unusual protein kinase regulating ubiquinone biosynthesis (AarF/ABC1/UbiB family)
MLAERVMRELFAWPIVLPGELVYFARTAVLIEGVGARYDPAFNSIRVASPVLVRLRRELLVALIGEEVGSDPVVRWAATLGAVAGGAVALIGSASSRWADEARSAWTRWRSATPENETARQRSEITDGRSD